MSVMNSSTDLENQQHSHEADEISYRHTFACHRGWQYLQYLYLYRWNGCCDVGHRNMGGTQSLGIREDSTESGVLKVLCFHSRKWFVFGVLSL